MFDKQVDTYFKTPQKSKLWKGYCEGLTPFALGEESCSGPLTETWRVVKGW